YDTLCKCVREHQDVLWTVALLQDCFSEPTFAQFTISLVIICVTAFQLVFNSTASVRALSMSCYLLNMIEQIYIYCYEGNELSIESENISRAAYEFPWYTCSVGTRRYVLIMMTRCRRIAKLTAAGFTTLSLASFMSILKASYTFFTVLRQINDKKE
ncbi:odorant receptor 63a-like, partial [Leptidea sinapis]|uniref:odorant receptor 63a-like n=1 Tax=Leptidea sinapis TaxID=189913 RepID=UPI0021C27C0D